MKTISLALGKRRLFKLWGVGAALLFVLFLVMSVGGPLQGDPLKAWSWFLPSCFPTLLLMVGVYVAEANQPPAEDRQIDSFVFSIAVWMSAAFLALILATLLYLPFGAAPDKSMAYLERANLWLAPVQGLATAALGAFFVAKKK